MGKEFDVDCKGLSLLDTPCYVILVVFVCFLTLSGIFEEVVGRARDWCIACKKHGLLAALRHILREVLLLGLISFLLLAFEDKLQTICGPAKLANSRWTVMGNAQANCPCCLKDTAYVNPCFSEDKRCGVPNYSGVDQADETWCNCDLIDVCPANASLYNVILSTRSVQYCDGVVPALFPTCNNKQGRVPYVGDEALHQIHLLLFLVALFHIVTAAVILVVANVRMRSWAQWKRDDDQQARLFSQRLTERLPKVSKAATAVKEAFRPGATSAAKGATAAMTLSAVLDRLESPSASEGTGNHAAGNPNSHRKPDANSREISDHTLADRRTRSDGSQRSSATAKPAEQPVADSATHDEQRAAAATNTGVLQAISEQQHEKSSMQWSALLDVLRQLATAWQPDGIQEQGRADGELADVESAPPRTRLVRTHAVHKNRVRSLHGLSRWQAAIIEWCICVRRQFQPNVITHEEFSTVRASFMLTHRVDDDSFDFMEMMDEALDTDFAKVVGLSIELWLVLCCFLAVWPIAPFAPFIFVMLNVAVVLIVNAKLIHVIRYASRGGRARRVEKETFWFTRPKLLLHPVKMWCWPVFLLWQFGFDSCFFTDMTWQKLSTAVPFWVVLIINFFIMLNLALTTLPLYTLAVLLGSDFGDTHERHQPLAERLHKLFMRHSREQAHHVLHEPVDLLLFGHHGDHASGSSQLSQLRSHAANQSARDSQTAKTNPEHAR